jgi:signal transduction histidine kinase/CheY-like chemotaxis protein
VSAPPLQLLATAVTHEQDVFALRRDGRAIAEIIGLERQDQIRLATALSELGRDRLSCAEVTVRVCLVADTVPALAVTMRWADGPPPAAEALSSARRLVRELTEQCVGRRGVIVLRHAVPVPGDRFQEVADVVARALRDRAAANREEDLRAQTRDLIVALEEARAQGEELKLLNEELEQTNAGVMALYSELSSELEQTNTGVVALHAELEDKSRQLREASAAKTRFWANVSHELRGPLNSVIGLSRLLATAEPGELGEQQREQVSLIAASGETLRTLVDDLLDVAKAEAGQLVPQPASIELGLLLAHLEAVTRPLISHPSVALRFPDPASMPTLVTDETMLTRVLRNLISNSLKFTESGHVRVEVGPGTAGRLEITVTDTGIGIPEAEQARIFEEFYQVRGPHQRGNAGTGLGLPYARRLVELLGGTLTLSSAPGRGTRVAVDLPNGPAPAPAVATRVPCLVSCDDDQVFAATFHPLLAQIAETVVQVGGGTELLAAARRENPSAIVLDLDMPEMDGYETIRLLAAAEDLASIPVVVLTGFPSERIERARLGHARAVLTKDRPSVQDLARALGLAPPEGGPA